tara:strand:+ start:38530 stop:39669 length:1140 start_codon:yes stop_codon:yes gene_type:complete
MALILNEEQQSLKDIAQDFLDKNAPISHFREIRDSDNKTGYSKELWKKIADLGWAGILVSEDYGGFNFGMMGMGGILEETGKNLTPSPLFSTAVLGASLLSMAGNETQKNKYLPALVSGDLTTAFALEEGNHHAPTKISTTSNKKGNDFVIDGKKNFVIDGHSADLIIVAARTSGNQDDTDGISLFCVDSENKNLKIVKQSMVDSRNVSEIHFDKVVVSEEDLLGDLNNAYPVIQNVLDIATVAISAEMLGNASKAFEITLNYLKERKQFGVLIGSFQALKHRAAEMYSELELTKSTVISAMNAIDEQSNDIARLSSLSKFKACETSHLVSNESVQMHGGVGVTDEYDVGLFLKRSRVAEQIFGNAEYHVDRYANLSEY